MIIQAKKIHPEAKLPERAHASDAGLDLFILDDVVLEKGAIVVLGTGIAMAIPEGYVGLIWDKSGLAARHGLTCLGGVIDAGYRGEIMVTLANLGTDAYTITKHQKIAQLLIQEVALPKLEEVEELDETLRGENRFGSTGTH
ncbi:MAG: dUTP diphosphatase [Candidatus Moranbacteria bacterium]|nr:dUTP diphosphatase [Candidatus Moranbacteria bacterium]